MRQALGDARALLWILGKHGLQQATHVFVHPCDQIAHVPVQNGIGSVVCEPGEKLVVAPGLLRPLAIPRPQYRLQENGLQGAHANAPDVHEPRHRDDHRGVPVAQDPGLGELGRHVLGRESALLEPQVGARLHGTIEVDQLPLILTVLAEPHDVLGLDVHVHKAHSMQAPADANQGPLQFPQLLLTERLAAFTVVPEPIL
mmetsp:Transcript_104042/g.303741  ORF Transcript_104042/g.303741 Transcript_104042/m.303741 type:complete len:200 (-) Transcript_104042:577-1176(-)